MVFDDAANYHKVMKLLFHTRMAHGECTPRSERKCTHCNAIDDLRQMMKEYQAPKTGGDSDGSHVDGMQSEDAPS